MFTSFQLSSHVPEDNLYRRLKDALDLQWLYKTTKKYYGSEGQKSIDPVVFFKLILIGYLENLQSDRRIISTVSMRLDMLYFIGYGIDEEMPWHSTLSRTRQLYSQEVFKELFKQVLEQCIEKGMVAGHCQVVDSVFVKANASMESLVKKEILEEGAVYAGNVYEQEKEGKNNNNGGRTSNKDYFSPTDPDARVATKPGKPTQLNYLAQVSVDSESYVITNIDAFHADKRDSECVAEVVQNTVNNLQPHGLLVDEVIADTNYSSSTALKYLDDNGITAYIPNIGSYKPDREGFTYDAGKDEFICSQGASLPFKNMKQGKAGRYN